MITRIYRKAAVLAILFTFHLSLFTSVQAGDLTNYQVVPLPQSIQMQRGEPFVLNDQVQILATEGLQREAQFLQQYIKEVSDIDLTIADKRQKKAIYIALSVSPKVTNTEGYVLTVSAKGITIEGGSSAGVFYGIQTLRKNLLFPLSSFLFPPTIITDAPRFTWRGMHLDCSRHFFSTDFVKKFIDLLALHNMNRFHWHLTDDQGWRIEIKKWPKLISVGSQRSGTIIGTNSDIDDGIPYGGYYTQDEAREIVAYAAERHITVILRSICLDTCWQPSPAIRNWAARAAPTR